MIMKTLILGLSAALAILAASDTRILNAVQRGDKALVQSLIAARADIDGAQGDGLTALHVAAYNGNAELAAILLQAGANTKVTTRVDSATPLFMAAKGGNAPIVDALLKAGGNANDANGNGTTALMAAAASGSLDAVRVLLDAGADVNKKENTNGQTALMFAAALNRGPSIRLLLSRGADAAVTTKVEKLGRQLIDANGDNIPSPSAAQADANAQTDQEKARAQRNRAAAQDRVFGAQTMGGMTALHFAARDGQMEAVAALTEGGVDVNTVSANNKTSAMVEALINAHFDIAKYLLDHGANPNLANDDGLTALYATEDMQWRSNTWYPQPNATEEKTNYLDLMKELVAKGANVNAQMTRALWYRKFRYGNDWADVAGATTFWRAAQANDIAGMKTLLALGADPKIANKHGMSPLMVAAGLGFEWQFTNIVPGQRLEAVKYLFEDLHLDLNAKDDKGYTALHGTAYVGDNDTIKYMVSKGADPKARSNARLGGTQGSEDVAIKGDGDSVADMANGPREKSLLFPETVALLESMGSYNSHNCRSTGCINPTKQDKPKTSEAPATADRPAR
jgi:ankyrin repeat protein